MQVNIYRISGNVTIIFTHTVSKYLLYRAFSSFIDNYFWPKTNKNYSTITFSSKLLLFNNLPFTWLNITLHIIIMLFFFMFFEFLFFSNEEQNKYERILQMYGELRNNVILSLSSLRNPNTINHFSWYFSLLC